MLFRSRDYLYQAVCTTLLWLELKRLANAYRRAAPGTSFLAISAADTALVIFVRLALVWLAGGARVNRFLWPLVRSTKYWGRDGDQRLFIFGAIFYGLTLRSDTGCPFLSSPAGRRYRCRPGGVADIATIVSDGKITGLR